MDENQLIYELPLNERLRLFLRLEHLFQQAAVTLQGETDWDSRNTLGCFTDIIEILVRADVKTELLKYLERLQGTLSRLKDMDMVDAEQLQYILAQLDENQHRLFKTSGQLVQDLRNHHLISAILQRKTVAAGTCQFDLPIYHFWLQQPAERRLQLLNDWHKELGIIRKPVTLILQLIRTSSEAESLLAEKGFYQTSLDTNRDTQLIRVMVERGLSSYAEISGSKHRISVRFMLEQDAQRPIQTEDDIPFQLSCCSL